MFTVAIPDQQGLPTSRMSSITYFVFAKAPNCQTEGEKKTMTYFRVLFHLCKSIYKPLKLHFSMNDKCNYLSLAIKTCPY